MSWKFLQQVPRAARRPAVAALAVWVAAAGAAVAQSPGRVAVIDVQRLVTESTVGQAALEELRSLKEEKEAEAEAMQSEVEELQGRLEEGKLSLSDDRQQELQKELEEKLIAFQRFTSDADRELEEGQSRVLATVERQVMPIITEVGQEMEYSAIFNKYQSGILFALDQVDITDLILQRFDQRTQPGVEQEN